MNAKVFISTTGTGLIRAERRTGDKWAVESLLEGQQVNCLVADPNRANSVMAGTQHSGLLRSDDLGKTWQPAGLGGQVIKSIAFCRAEPDVIYVGTKPPAIFVSHDAGESWSELESFRQMRRRHWFTPAEPGDPYVMGLAVAPSDLNHIVAGIEYGALLHSTDGGKTWQGHLKGASRDCHSLTFHVSDGNWVYEGGGGPPASVSRDGGKTWTSSRKGMGGCVYGYACAADPGDPEIWYVSAAPLVKFPQIHMFPRMHWDGHSNSFIFRSTKAGRWERLDGGLPQPLDYAVYALLTDPGAPGHLYAGLSNGDVWFTGDHGDHWAQLPVNMRGIHRSLIMLCDRQSQGD
jgi:hypothetical protein